MNKETDILIRTPVGDTENIHVKWYKTQEMVEKEMEKKTNLRTVSEDKWERKEYTATCDSDLVREITKIRLHAWELKKNYPRE